MCVLSVRLFVTPWAATPQAPLPLGLPHQEHWSGWPFPSPGDLPDPGTEPVSPVAPAGAGSLPLSWPGSPQSLKARLVVSLGVEGTGVSLAVCRWRPERLFLLLKGTQ